MYNWQLIMLAKAADFSWTTVSFQHPNDGFALIFSVAFPVSNQGRDIMWFPIPGLAEPALVYIIGNRCSHSHTLGGCPAASTRLRHCVTCMASRTTPQFPNHGQILFFLLFWSSWASRLQMDLRAGRKIEWISQELWVLCGRCLFRVVKSH